MACLVKAFADGKVSQLEITTCKEQSHSTGEYFLRKCVLNSSFHHLERARLVHPNELLCLDVMSSLEIGPT